MSLKAVIDTNVLIAALRSKRGASYRLFREVGGPRLRLLLSATLAIEYEAVAKRERTSLWATADDIEDILDFVCASAEKPLITFKLRPAIADPGDEHLLELALGGGADAIVTFNVRDFRDANRFGMAILTPTEFLAISLPEP